MRGGGALDRHASQTQTEHSCRTGLPPVCAAHEPNRKRPFPIHTCDISARAATQSQRDYFLRVFFQKRKRHLVSPPRATPAPCLPDPLAADKDRTATGGDLFLFTHLSSHSREGYIYLRSCTPAHAVRGAGGRGVGGSLSVARDFGFGPTGARGREKGAHKVLLIQATKRQQDNVEGPRKKEEHRGRDANRNTAFVDGSPATRRLRAANNARHAPRPGPRPRSRAVVCANRRLTYTGPPLCGGSEEGRHSAQTTRRVGIGAPHAHSKQGKE